jgi:hypothetical protein
MKLYNALIYKNIDTNIEPFHILYVNKISFLLIFLISGWYNVFIEYIFSSRFYLIKPFSN